MPSKEAERSAEFNRLLNEQALLVRSMKYGLKLSDSEKQVADARAARLIELAELMPGWWQRNLTWHDGKTETLDTAEAYVNDRIRKWLEMNPLPALSQDIVSAGIDGERGVYVVIGNLSAYGYQYRLMRDDIYDRGSSIALNVPDSVAEHFRQQGRRQMQSEFRALLNAQRA